MATRMSTRALEHWRERHQHRSLLNDKEWRETFDLALAGKDLIFALDALWAIAEITIETTDTGACRVAIDPAENHQGWSAEAGTLREAILLAAERLKEPEHDPRQSFLTQRRA